MTSSKTLGIAILGGLLACGCTTVIVPPGAPPDAQVVFVLDHGRHTSLVLPDADGGLVRYAYGDWAWYAEGRTGLREGSVALLGPSPAALGRRELPGPPERAQVERAVRVGIVEIYQLAVAARSVVALRRELDAIYTANLHTRVYNPQADLAFVSHPVPYSLRHNSNTVVAAWLRELGVKVDGAALVAKWRVVLPDADQ